MSNLIQRKPCALVLLISFAFGLFGCSEGETPATVQDPISYSQPDVEKIFKSVELVSIEFGGDATFPDTTSAIIDGTSIVLTKVEDAKYSFFLPLLSSGVYDLVITAPDGTDHIVTLNVEQTILSGTPQENIAESISSLIDGLSELNETDQIELQPLIEDLNTQFANVENLTLEEQEWLAMFFVANFGQLTETKVKSEIPPECLDAQGEFLALQARTVSSIALFSLSLALIPVPSAQLFPLASAVYVIYCINRLGSSLDEVLEFCVPQISATVQEDNFTKELPLAAFGNSQKHHWVSRDFRPEGNFDKDPSTLSFDAEVSRSFYIESTFETGGQAFQDLFSQFITFVNRILADLEILPQSLRNQLSEYLEITIEPTETSNPIFFSIENISDSNISSVVSAEDNQLVFEFDFIGSPQVETPFTFDLVDNRTGRYGSQTQHSAILYPFSMDMTTKTANSVTIYSECLDVPLGWNYSFTSTSMTLSGSDSWEDECVPGSNGSFTLDMSSFDSGNDIPFACDDYPLCRESDFNRILSGIDEFDRNFVSTYSFNPETNVLSYTKVVGGVSYSEIITIMDQ